MFLFQSELRDFRIGMLRRVNELDINLANFSEELKEINRALQRVPRDLPRPIEPIRSVQPQLANQNMMVEDLMLRQLREMQREGH